MGITQQIGASSIIKPGVIDNTAARPASPYEGQVIFQKDTDQLLVWNGTAWVIPNSPAQNPDGLALVTTCTATFAGGTAGSVSNGVVTIGTNNTSFTVSNAFSSTYDNYRVIMSGGVGSTNIDFSMQLGSTNTDYYGSVVYCNYNESTARAIGTNAGTSCTYVGGADGSFAQIIVDINAPNLLNRATTVQGQFQANTPFGTSSYRVATNLQYTAFSIFCNLGNITGGTLRVYGYRK